MGKLFKEMNIAFNVTSCNSTYWVLDYLPALYWRPVIGSLIVIVAILATLENAIILIVFYKHSALRTTSNKILISMCVADLFTGLITGPLYGMLLLGDSLIGNCISNELRRYFATLFLGASALSVGMLSIDRSLHLRRLQNYSVTKHILYPGLFLSWFVPTVVPLIGLIDAGVYSGVLFAIGSMAVLVVIISYAVLVVTLKKYRTNACEQMKMIYLKRERGAGVTVVIIITCYVAMLLPLLIEKLLYATRYYEGKSQSDKAKLTILAHFLCMCNSVVNPIIYVSRIPDLRKHVLHLLKFWRDENSSGDRVSSSSASTCV